jgi:hypothetical protein
MLRKLAFIAAVRQRWHSRWTRWRAAATTEVVTAAGTEAMRAIGVATGDIGAATVTVDTGTAVASGAAMASAPAGDRPLPDGFGSATNDKRGAGHLSSFPSQLRP